MSRLNEAVAIGAASVLLLVLNGSAIAVAQTGGSSEWPGRIERIENLLEKGKWQAARKQATRLADEIEANAWDRYDLDRLLAAVGRCQAVAEINLGMDRDALWHWHSAWNLSPPTDIATLGAFGRAGVLVENRLRPLGRMPQPFVALDDLDLLQVEPVVLPVVERPVLANDSASRSGRLPDLLIEVVIDRDGRLLHPVVDDTGVPPVAVWATLEWLLTYPPARPATRDGDPVDVLQLLTIELGRDRKRAFVTLN